MTAPRHTAAAHNNAKRLNRQDITWALGLYGTAIGAGVLFLPITAGVGGLWSLLTIALLAFPVTFFSHRALTRFVLSGDPSDRDITAVVERHFGPKAGVVFTLLYFFAIFPILLVYSVAITNTTLDILQYQLHITPPSRALVAFVLIAGLIAVARGGEQRVVRAMSWLVYPFITALVVLSLMLIPNWSSAFFTTPMPSHGTLHGLTSLWLALPVLVFAFNHSPIISAFAIEQRQRYGQHADQKCTRILLCAHLLMVATVLLFVFSCVLSLTPEHLAEAKADNITILSYLARHFQTPAIGIAAPIIALVAIAKSFLGHYIGAREGAVSLIAHSRGHRGTPPHYKHMNDIAAIGMGAICWLVATLDPSILGMIEQLGGPIIAALLFLLPMIAIRKVPVMARYSGRWSNVLVTVVGILAVSATLSLFAH